MRVFGLIGYPLGHSFSKKYFTDKFSAQGIQDAMYENFPLEDISMFPGLLEENPEIAGLNVTIPYKEKIIPYLDELSPEAARIGAVNCISLEEGKLTGHNTDAWGFRCSLLEFIGSRKPKALILGTGGASKAVKYVLEESGMDFLTVSRTEGPGRITYPRLDEGVIAAHKLIINTTPLGTFPDTDSCPDIPYHLLTPEHRLYDLVYNPRQTEFMKRGMARGARTVNGYAMLSGQAERAWEIWNGRI
ncbi:MAG: shikimate dehydrogenase [Rikenellaceae bacterium]|nr:shikimate dehydrogenase [Rikenellaceae bacterium]